MAYIRQNFEDGMTLTAEHMNNIDEGLAGALPLDGGTMTGEMAIAQGDGNGIQLGENGHINATYGTQNKCTILGVSDAGTSTFGHPSFAMNLRGKGSRPTFNSTKEVALMSDVSTKAPNYTYGKTDLEPGVSALETGKLHFVYE